jgi:hypothetical protein
MIPANKRKSDPDLCSVLDQMTDNIKSSLNCISIGTIQSFDPTDQTATILLNYKRINLYDTDKVTDYQPLVKCPVFILNGGGAYITFPIAKGDSCLVLFCDREIDTWFTKGGTNAPQSARVHDLNDGIALIGVKNTGNFISGYYTDGPMMFYKGSYIAIDNSGNILMSSPDNATITITGNVNLVATGNLTIKGATVDINPP